MFRAKPVLSWRSLPTEMGASQCWAPRRLKKWIKLGLYQAIVQRLLTRLKADGWLDLAEALIDGGPPKAPCCGENRGRTQRTEAAAGASST